MAVVKSVRRVGRAMGRVVDEEDRMVLAKFAVLVGGGGSLILAAAGALGLAWRLFGIAAG